MRDYGAVSPRFWTGTTGRRLRGHLEAQLVALYLQTSPGSHMIGLYCLALPTLCHETGLSQEGASKGLLVLEREGFAYYDAEEEVVWVPEMARFQIGAFLQPADKRVRGVENELENFRKSKFFNAFLDKYGRAFKLKLEREPTPPPASPSDAPSEPLASPSEAKTGSGSGQDSKNTQRPKSDSPTPKSEPLVLTPPTPKPKRPAPPEQATACRQAWSERWEQEYRQLTGEAYAWSAADRQAVVTVCNLAEQDLEKATHLLEEFLRRCASDQFYAKNRTPRFIASRVNELRLPLSTNGSNGAHPQALHSANVVFTPEQEQAHLEGGRKI